MGYKYKEDEAAYQRKWSAAKRKQCLENRICSVCLKAPAREGLKTCLACMEVARKGALRYRRNTQKQLRNFYGNSCECCGETEPKFLNLDHINNDGSIQRRKFPNEHSYYAYLVRQIKKGAPILDIRTLCSNCNMGRARNGGACPHNKHSIESANYFQHE
jgi:hypothetical protein